RSTPDRFSTAFTSRTRRNTSAGPPSSGRTSRISGSRPSSGWRRAARRGAIGAKPRATGASSPRRSRWAGGSPPPPCAPPRAGRGRLAGALMRALAESGDLGAALQQFKIHESLLREEIGSAPEAAVTAFAESLRSGTWVRAPEKPRVEGGGRRAEGGKQMADG